jgi:hypothetical protein
MVQNEILNAVYNDDTQRITVVTGLKDVEEVNPPTDTFPGTPVDGIRWIRQITETFTGSDLEIHSTVVSPFLPGATELLIQDVSRLPNSGSVVVNRGSATEETVTYVSRDTVNNKLLGVSSPTNSHFIGEIVFPSTDIDFLGAFEIDLRPFGTEIPRGPIRHSKTIVTLNNVVNLKENEDYTVVNDFVGSVCTRTRLRFEQAGQPRRFSSGDFITVQYEFFVQLVGAVEIFTSFGQTSFIPVFDQTEVEIAFGTLETADRELPDIGNVTITPPFSNSVLPPDPVKVTIPDVFLPIGVTITEEINIATTDIPVSDVSKFPAAGTLFDTVDDAANRTVTIGGDTIAYDDVDLVNNKLTGAVGITSTHAAGTDVVFDGAQFTRDVVKNAINTSTLRGQIEALSVNVGGRHLRLKTKGSLGTFNLQPGTYQLFFLGFNGDTDRGLHSDVTTSTPFQNNDLTFERHQGIIKRQEIAKELLGKTLSRRTELTATNPTDVTLSVP